MSEVRFGSYRIVEPLGSGALSSIYKAVQEPLGRVVALKALKSQIAPTSSFGEQLDRESKILRDLAHPNVVLLLDAARSTSGRPYLVLEHVDGPSLQKLLTKKRTLSVEASLAIAIGLCSGLSHCHDRGVVHRDVKPSNVLLATSGLVKLIDFGIAQRARTASVSDALGAEGITPSGRIAPEAVKDAFGTPAYMSPEQILGDFVDGRSDLFSLGVVLYQMLCGSRPFEAPKEKEKEKEREERRRMRRDAPAPLRDRAPDVPRSIERIVMRLLEKSPNDRYVSADHLLEKLQRELRAITREDPTTAVRRALVESGFVTVDRRAAQPGSDAPQPPAPAPRTTIRRALAGQAAVLVLFAAGVLAVESGSSARDGRHAGERPLELVPENAGGLRVIATPWAHVRVDGRDVETTPFARAIPLPAGKHFVRLSHPDAPPVDREIDVVANETVTLDVTMSLGALEDAGKDAR
ncbi:MAG: serine/threonine protein kinase [Deltaproteobacteria bacterium]|nr:serine/threonine protein kinase [Deltaproteobacteria bacterium]